MRAVPLGVLMIAACYRPAPPAHPTSSDLEPDDGALVAVAPAVAAPGGAPLADAPAAVGARRAAIATGAKATLFVAGCNVGCVDCGLGSYQSVIVGILDRTGEQLFPSPDPPAPGYSCGAAVAIGERVTLRARTSEGLSIESWSGFGAGDACPCAGTQAMTCSFVVTPEIASHHERIYCGATWKQHATAQIGR